MAGSTLVLIPGLGADAAIYEPQRRALGARLVVPPWPEPDYGRDTLETYARRIADAVRARPDVSRPFCIGGLSLGGILAAEIAECCADDVAGVFLIGACLDRSEIPAVFHLLARAGQWAPTGLMLAAANRLAPAFISWWQGLDAEMADLYASVYSRGNKRLLRWAALAMSQWQSKACPRAPVYRAHGRRDQIIPIPEHRFRAELDLVVPDGNHLINMTHATPVNRWLLARMDASTPRRPPGGRHST